jgi:hypothetical protein
MILTSEVRILLTLGACGEHSAPSEGDSGAEVTVPDSAMNDHLGDQYVQKSKPDNDSLLSKLNFS